MSIADHNKKVISFRDAMHRISETPDGKLVLNQLRLTHVNPSSIDKDTHLTYYRLGKADLVKFLLECADKGGK